jgi:hypothetical protein
VTLSNIKVGRLPLWKDAEEIFWEMSTDFL